jgi:hypothetical protein
MGLWLSGKLKSLLAETAQEAVASTYVVLALHKKEAAGLQAHEDHCAEPRRPPSRRFARSRVCGVTARVSLGAVRGRRWIRRIGLLVLLAGVAQAAMRLLRPQPPAPPPPYPASAPRSLPDGVVTEPTDGAADAPDLVERPGPAAAVAPANQAEPPAPPVAPPPRQAAVPPTEAAPAKKAPAKKAPAKKAAAGKAAPAKKAPAKKSAAKKAAPPPPEDA